MIRNVARIFLDESGDLGFGERSSRWFVITIVLTSNHRKVERCVKKTHEKLKKKYKRIGELHAYHSDEVTRKRVLRSLAEVEDLQVSTLILNKRKVYTNLRLQKNYLYNYTANILLDRLHNKKVLDEKDEVLVFIDQRVTNKFLKENFTNYLENNLGRWEINGLQIKIKPSHTEKCLQAVDFISWAVFRKYEQSDYEYYEIIKGKIIDEQILFP